MEATQIEALIRNRNVMAKPNTKGMSDYEFACAIPDHYVKDCTSARSLNLVIT